MTTQTHQDDFVYVGIKGGTIRALVVDDPKYPKDTADLVAEWITMGRTVERVDRKVAVDRMKIELKDRTDGVSEEPTK